MNRLAYVLSVGRWHLPTGADADADAEVEGIFAQQQELRRRRMRKLLFKGASKGNEQDVQKAIDSGVSVNRVDGDEDPPLILAARIGSIGVLRQLLDAGAIIDARSSTQLETALSTAPSFTATRRRHSSSSVRAPTQTWRRPTATSPSHWRVA